VGRAPAAGPTGAACPKVSRIAPCGRAFNGGTGVTSPLRRARAWDGNGTTTVGALSPKEHGATATVELLRALRSAHQIALGWWRIGALSAHPESCRQALKFANAETTS
jgi:hypothetical protein